MPTPTTAPRPVTGGLLPREHGAYAQLAFPLLTGLGYARFHTGAIAFAVAAVALFLAHEPLALIWGVRGARLQEALGTAARRRLVVLLAAAALGLLAAIGLAPGRAWAGALAVAVLAAPLLPVLGRRGIKSLPAELLAAATFSSSLLPLALTGPAGWRQAIVAAAVWLGAAAPAILAVHAVKAKKKGKREGRWTLVATPVSAIVVALAAVGAAVAAPWARHALAVLPPALATLTIGLLLPHPRHLKRIGWTMVVADSLTLLLVLAIP